MDIRSRQAARPHPLSPSDNNSWRPRDLAPVVMPGLMDQARKYMTIEAAVSLLVLVKEGIAAAAAFGVLESLLQIVG